MFYAKATLMIPAKQGRLLQERNAEAFSGRFGRLIATVGGQASSSIVNVFDGLFCEQHFSWRCLLRSCLASLISVAVCILIMLSVVGFDSLIYIYRNSSSSFGQRIQNFGFSFSTSEYLFWVLAIPLVMNLLADYLALYKTRRLLSWMRRQKTVWSACSGFLIDQAGTYLCFFLGLLVTTLVVIVGLLGVGFVWEAIQETEGAIPSMGGHLLHLLAAMNQPVVMIPCVMSTFFSSFWLWLFGLSILIPKIAEVGPWVSSRIRMSSAQ